MFIEEKGKLYDGHEECREALDCLSRKNVSKFGGCSGIMGEPSARYCLYHENCPHIEVGLAFIACNDEP